MGGKFVWSIKIDFRITGWRFLYSFIHIKHWEIKERIKNKFDSNYIFNKILLPCNFSYLLYGERVSRIWENPCLRIILFLKFYLFNIDFITNNNSFFISLIDCQIHFQSRSTKIKRFTNRCIFLIHI